jgi:Na+-driven multidrug efflux pump
LPLTYIDVLSADLGFSSIFSVFATSITIFVPANYQAGNLKRVKDFLKIIAIATLIYSFICAGLYFSLANWHFSSIFENVETVKYGISFWKTYSLAMIPVSSLFVFLFVLCPLFVMLLD